MHRWPCPLIRSREPSRSRSASPRRSTSTRSFTGPRVRSTKSPRVLPEPTPQPCPLPGSITDRHHVRYFGRQLPDAVNSRCRPKCAGREWQVSGKPTGYWASYPRTSGDSRCLKVASRQKSGPKLNGSLGDIAICTQLRRKGVNRRRQLTRYLGKTASKGSGASVDNSPSSAADACPVTLVSDGKQPKTRHLCFAACWSSVRQRPFSRPKSPDAPEPQMPATEESCM